MITKRYRNRYASIEQEDNGRWFIYNDVQGLLVKECASYDEAHMAMVEIYQYYAAIELPAGSLGRSIHGGKLVR